MLNVFRAANTHSVTLTDTVREGRREGVIDIGCSRSHDSDTILPFQGYDFYNQLLRDDSDNRELR